VHSCAQTNGLRDLPRRSGERFSGAARRPRSRCSAALPAQRSAYPRVVVLAGSGTSRRDHSSAGKGASIGHSRARLDHTCTHERAHRTQPLEAAFPAHICAGTRAHLRRPGQPQRWLTWRECSSSLASRRWIRESSSFRSASCVSLRSSAYHPPSTEMGEPSVCACSRARHAKTFTEASRRAQP
jgi:hypothetical protein